MKFQRDMPLQDVEIETPLVKNDSKQLAGKKKSLYTYPKSWFLGMVDGTLDSSQQSKVGHVGMYRDQ